MALEEGYVTGLEPATNYPNLRNYERKQGRVKLLPPGGTWTARWSIEVADTPQGVLALQAEVATLQAHAKATVHRTETITMRDSRCILSRFALLSLLAVTFPMRLPAQEVAKIPSQDLKAGKDEKKRYFLIGPAKDAKAPKDGYGLIVVMPGGSGSADFLPFVKRIYKNAVPEGYLIAQPVAVKWKDDQEIVWPTARVKADGMKFTTEAFVEAVIDDVGGRHKIDKTRVFTLSWSSSGPAAYATSLSGKKVTGSLVAMSVFNPKYLPDLEKGKGHAFYLYHSKDDKICPFHMAEQAQKDLKKAGARVKLTEYEGGHGWRGDVYGSIKDGIRWLEKNARGGK
jgi:predicted esterase